MGGGRVVRWYWVNFQCRGVLLVFYSHLSLSKRAVKPKTTNQPTNSLGVDPIKTEILSKLSPKTTNRAGASYNLDASRARAYFACSRCGWGWFGHFLLPSIISLLSPSLWETARYSWLVGCFGLKGPWNSI